MAGKLNAVGAAVFAPAKLNLFLHVNGRRPDGYHLLQSIFVLLSVGDKLTISNRNDGIIRRTTDLAGVHEQDDLVIRAAQLLRRQAPADQQAVFGADIGVEKVVPMGGGLGGGSSDAATTLIQLNRLWKLNFSLESLQSIGLSLGADVPFFLFGKSAWAEGIGEKLQAYPVPMWWYVVLSPAASVSTPWIFKHPELTRDTIPLKIADFSASALAETRNDLQPVVLKEFPAVSKALRALQSVSQRSVFGARMTGSGACVFAAFETRQSAMDALSKLQPEYTGFVAQGLSKHPLYE